MDILYKLDHIEGKNLGCIAIKSIKTGTIIVEEKPVCYDGGGMKSKANHVDGKVLDFIWNSYKNMSQSDKSEYNKLYNRFKSDPSFFEEWKDSLMERNVTEEMADVMVEVCGIYCSNNFLQGVGIQSSRFNHSCAANAQFEFDKREEKFEIRTVTKIKAGEEITLNYQPLEFAMKNVKTRQKFLLDYWTFHCMCNLCMEECDSDDKIYEKFTKLQKEVEILCGTKSNSWVDQNEKIKKVVSCYKEMYKLAKEKKVSRGFIFSAILNPGFTSATQGYLLSLKARVPTQEFKSDCETFSRVGEKISTDLFGQEKPISIEWKKRKCDFEAWIRESPLFRNMYSSS